MDADHSFHVPARSGRTDRQIRSDVLDAFAAWADAILLPSPLEGEGGAPERSDRAPGEG